MHADLDAGVQERDRVRGAADTGVRLSVTVKTPRPLSVLRRSHHLFLKTHVYPSDCECFSPEDGCLLPLTK